MAVGESYLRPDHQSVAPLREAERWPGLDESRHQGSTLRSPPLGESHGDKALNPSLRPGLKTRAGAYINLVLRNADN